MKNIRLLPLVLLLAATFTVTGGGFAPEAEAKKPGGSVCPLSLCQTNDDCKAYCCPRSCDPEGNLYPWGGCYYLDPADQCGYCGC